jgi:1-phosphatidylinositol-3-phosphate 5-kinase
MAVVEVYSSATDAVQEPKLSDLDLGSESPALEPQRPTASTATSTNSLPRPAKDISRTIRPGRAGDKLRVPDEAADASSDTDVSLNELLPDLKELADSLEPSGQDVPKVQKSKLFKMLTNFWVERSSSGWEPLDYPVKMTDHLFIDSDVIVREDEPSSLIAFALHSDDYEAKVADISERWHTDEDMEMSLLQGSETHLKYQFTEGSAKMLCTIFYAEQFEAIRQKTGAGSRVVESLSRCLKWDSRSGKSGATFLKTLDGRLILKSLSAVETAAFLSFAPAYFRTEAKCLFHELPSAMAKMVGFFQVYIKNAVTNIDVKLDLLVMENLLYDRAPSRIFDLKGSMRNRRIQSTGQENEVLLDENMVEFMHESPIFVRDFSKRALQMSLWNDTLFLARQNVMDYSLILAIDNPNNDLVVGMVDCIRTYTLDKKFESWIKERGFAGGGRNRPTIMPPDEYKSRFQEAMKR